MKTNIRDILARRNDLGSFLVHLTKEASNQDAKENLISIIRDNCIRAVNNFGFAKSLADKGDINEWPQKTVCFTEAPLEHLHFLVEEIEGRRYQFGPYGIVITKKYARENSVNPVWYIENNSDLGKARQIFFNHILQKYREGENISSFFQITPYMETMGYVQNLNRNIEFWWEREWRKVGDMPLPSKYIVICPENDIGEFQALTKQTGGCLLCIDPAWSMEQIIASFAGFTSDEIDML